MNWTAKDDQVALALIGVLVVMLIVIRSCIPSEHQIERPSSPPESLYEPGG
jgi:hypothetical protein